VANRSAKEVKAKAMRVMTGMLPMLDSDDPNDNAFKLVSINFVLCRLFFYKKKLSNGTTTPT
jgi:hypothetical protein